MKRHTKRGYRLEDLHKPWVDWHPLDSRWQRYWDWLMRWADRMERARETQTGWFDPKYSKGVTGA